jgi:hypothetical protein
LTRTRKIAPLWQIVLVCLLWLGAAFVLSSLHATARQSPPLFLQARHNDIRFVFADLDGDQKPDLALIETQSRRSAKTNYSIRIKLSAGPESAVGVNGPMGGLQVAARDVNGDDYVDLIVTSNLDVHFVQVLLNDGRGNFSPAGRGDYAQLESENHESLQAPVASQADRTTLATTRPTDEGKVQAPDFHQVCLSGSSRRVEVSRPLAPALRLSPGRSPPLPIGIS